MSHYLRALPIVAALLAGCAATATHSTKPVAAHGDVAATVATSPVASGPLADDNLNATAWTQTALEHDLLDLQVYRDAQAHLLAALKDPRWDALPKEDRVTPLKGLKPAVILDVDETVLDNSPYQARLVRSGGEFNEADWAAWCKEEKARALPGAVAFAQFAASHGVAVIYLSNRAKDLDQATPSNLRKVGMPVSGPKAFLGLGTVLDGCEQAGSEKNCRRQLVGQHYRVLMQLGDQIGDFVSIYAADPTARDKAFAAYLPWVGTRWFVLPNPTYGAWESALFNNDYSQPREQRRASKIKALRTD